MCRKLSARKDAGTSGQVGAEGRVSYRSLSFKPFYPQETVSATAPDFTCCDYLRFVTALQEKGRTRCPSLSLISLRFEFARSVVAVRAQLRQDLKNAVQMSQSWTKTVNEFIQNEFAVHHVLGTVGNFFCQEL